MVDDEDFDYLSGYKWHTASFCAGKNLYARRCVSKGNAEQTEISMHRAIMKCNPGKDIDHIDSNGLNNQKSNLRECSDKENQHNRRKFTGTSRFKGVWREGSKFRSALRVDGKLIHLGTFESEQDAAIAYDKAASKKFGNFARINFEDHQQAHSCV